MKEAWPVSVIELPSQVKDQAVAAARHLPTSFLDRLFTPHGAGAYLRWLGPSAERPTAPTCEPTGGLANETGVATIRFARSGAEAAFAGTLLETAEAAGLEPRFRCRRGICGTCTTPKLAGTVQDLRTGDTSAAVGPVRLCVSVACSDVTLDL